MKTILNFDGDEIVAVTQISDSIIDVKTEFTPRRMTQEEIEKEYTVSNNDDVT